MLIRERQGRFPSLLLLPRPILLLFLPPSALGSGQGRGGSDSWGGPPKKREENLSLSGGIMEKREREGRAPAGHFPPPTDDDADLYIPILVLYFLL